VQNMLIDDVLLVDIPEGELECWLREFDRGGVRLSRR